MRVHWAATARLTYAILAVVTGVHAKGTHHFLFKAAKRVVGPRFLARAFAEIISEHLDSFLRGTEIERCDFGSERAICLVEVAFTRIDNRQKESTILNIELQIFAIHVLVV